MVELEPHADERGFFARLWCAREFEQAGLSEYLVQASLSRNDRRGTLRGMHLQMPPSSEAKLVRCTRGSIYDVVVDLRPDSETYLRHFGVTLTAKEGKALYVPPLMAHGFQTLEDNTDVLYQMTDYYAPQLGCGFRWNEPAFAIEWPIAGELIMHSRDRAYPDFDPISFAARIRATRP